MPSGLEGFLKQRLGIQADKGLLRTLTTAKPGSIDFTSNDYLGLARSSELFETIHQRTLELGTTNGSTGSRLLSGNSAYTESVESKLACIFEGESALIFNSGYSANLAVLSSLPQKNDTIIYDELSHACIKDGARLSLAKRYSFKHNSTDDLEAKVKISSGRVFVVVEGIYSMDGDECIAKELAELKRKYDQMVLIIDEAHSTGTLGKGGNGLVCSLELEQLFDVRIYTFGKAMGSHGACVVGTKALRDYLINFARPFIYTTAAPVHSIASIECSFDFLQKHIERQNELQSLASYYKLQSEKFSTKATHSQSAIQTVIVPGNDKVRAVARHLQEAGFDVRPIVAPTVPQGFERLRICLHTFNARPEVEHLCNHIARLTA